MIKNTWIIILTLALTLSCAENKSAKKSIETSKEIIEAYHSIEENIKKAEQNQPIKSEYQDIDGPYPADEYSLNPTGKFHFLALYVHEKDSTWLIIDSKTESEIVKKHPKLEVFKTRPNWITRDNWSNYRFQSIKQKMIFDIDEDPKGWLIKNEAKLK